MANKIKDGFVCPEFKRNFDWTDGTVDGTFRIKTEKEKTTTIRIPSIVKEELRQYALSKEAYHVTISRLLREVKDLRRINELQKELIEAYKSK